MQCKPAAAALSVLTSDDLTRREGEVARLAAQGLSNRRIAEVLVIAEKIVANHLQHALDKLEVHSRARLAARAVELGLAPDRLGVVFAAPGTGNIQP